MSDSIYCDDFKAQPFWWDSTPRPKLDQAELPEETDLLIIGSGYTGELCARNDTRWHGHAGDRCAYRWLGFVGYSFDYLPHLGEQDSLFYAMGYCGSGICLASYFGNRLGMQVLGRPEGRIAFNDIKFQSRPLYTGNPWFLGAVVNYHQIRDRFL